MNDPAVPSSVFAFVLCQPGAEAALKRELLALGRGWAAAYQRPGLVTFRSPAPLAPDFALPSVFARQHGVSLGTRRELDEIVELASALPGPLCLQVAERAPSDPDDPEPSERVRALTASLRARLAGRLTETSTAHVGDEVLSVVIGDGDAPLVGLHRHGRGRCPFPGGRTPIVLPPEAPSRAYLKIEEAIAAFSLPLRPGDVALEIGAAPGGAAYALARRGVHVIAVDPAEMDPGVLAYEGPRGARVMHQRVAVADLSRATLPERIDWLLLDVHLAPQVALRAARRLASLHKSTLCGAVLTLKLNDWRFAERVPSFLQQAREMGLVAPVARQLASHRQELAVVGLTKMGAARI